MRVRLATDLGGGGGGVPGVEERDPPAPRGDEEFAALGDVDAVGGDGAVQVLHEEAAPQHRPRHGAGTQRGLDAVMRNDPGPVGAEDRDVDHVPDTGAVGGLDERDDGRAGRTAGGQGEEQEDGVDPGERRGPGGGIEEVQGDGLRCVGVRRRGTTASDTERRRVGPGAEHLDEFGADVARGSGDQQHEAHGAT